MREAAAEVGLLRGQRRTADLAMIAAGCLLFASVLLLYLRTGAPSLLSGDAAEHQFSAAVVGVPHATGYPLFTMLNALAVRILPIGDAARRVTVAVALYSALAVLLVYVVAQRLSGSLLVGLLSAIALAQAPEFWALATVAEVYTLQALLILSMLLALLHWWEIEARELDLGLTRRGLRHPLAVASLFAGLGATHHGSFTPIVAPALLAGVVGPLLWRLRIPAQRWMVIQLIRRCLVWAIAGFSPWLYLIAQYLLFQPFDYYRGQGLPYHPYWGNPQGWGDVLNLALGAGFRSKIWTADGSRLLALLPGYVQEISRQFTLAGLALGVLGALALLRRAPRAGLFALLVFFAGSLFGLNIANDVPKAHVYFLPSYVIWSVWIGVGGAALADSLARAIPTRIRHIRRLTPAAIVVVLIAFFLRAADQIARLDRSGDWESRHSAEIVLDAVKPDAVILCRWEECMSLRYLQLVEGQQLGVQLDQSEPGVGVSWADRAALYLPSHPVYAVG
ncbi:MAG: DUF2723 domain-containing protein, partial [Roseiflexaceae bacterium]